MEPKTEMQKNAIESARLQKQKIYQRALDIQWLNSRMEDSGMGRCISQIQREAEMEREFQERTDHAALVNARAEKETALGIAIANEHREETCKILRRMHLRERDPELRELTKKLTAGYVCRDLRQQILDNEYKKLQAKAEDNQANDALANALYLDKEAFDMELQQQAEQSKKYCLELQQQLVNRQRQKQCEYEDMLIEKKMLEDVMRTIADEDQKELQQKREQMAQYRRESDAFRKVREAWREKQKQLVIKEERQIEEQAKVAGDRSADIAAERQRKLREREIMNEKVVEKTLAEEAERNEREQIIKQLQEQEYLEKNHQDDIAEKNKFEQVKADTMRTLSEQMKNKKNVEREERRKEAAYRKSMPRNLTRDERNQILVLHQQRRNVSQIAAELNMAVEEKMNAENDKARQREIEQREKKKKYIEELRAQIASNAKRKEAEKKLEEQRVQSVWAYHDNWDKEVAEERRSIVRAHVPLVLGYLQAGTLRPADAAVGPGGGLGGGPSDAGATRPKCNAQCRRIREY